MKCLFIPRSKFNYFSLSFFFFFTEENGEPKDAKGLVISWRVLS